MKNFWTYKIDYPTPQLQYALQLGAISPETVIEEWDKLTPGFNREIIRSTIKEKKCQYQSSNPI